MKVGILGNSKFSSRNIIPVLIKDIGFNLKSIGSRSYGDNTNFVSYESVIFDSEIELVYIPLPPSLHYSYAKRCMEQGKHVILEKPFCLKSSETKELVNIAKNSGLFLAENYVFQYHNQWIRLKDEIAKREESIRRVEIDFSFPLIDGGDNFRYNNEIGGGGFMDAGAYGLKALIDLDLSPSLSFAKARKLGNTDVGGNLFYDIGENSIATINYGMCNAYRSSILVELENSYLELSKPFSSKPKDKPILRIVKNGIAKKIDVASSNQYLNAFKKYKNLIESKEHDSYYEEILFMDELRSHSYNELRCR